MQTLFRKPVWKLLFGFLFFITAMKILFVGYDIDEQYAVAMSYRMAGGDFPLLAMWEPHQTSGFGASLFILPFLALAKTTAGIFLYLRICGLVLHSLVTCLLYRQLARRFSVSINLMICCIWFFSLPKLMFLPEFSNIQLWLLMLMIFCLLQYYTRPAAAGKAPLSSFAWLVSAGFCMAGEVLTYPSTILAFPVCLFLMVRRARDENRALGKKGTGGEKRIGGGKSRLFRELAAFVLPCLLCAVCFAGILLSRMSLTELLALLPIVASDGSHSISLSEKLASNLASLKELLLFFALYSAAALVLFGCYRCLRRLFFSGARDGITLSLGGFFPGSLLFCTLAGQALIWLFCDRYPNYPLAEYFFVPAMGICYAVRIKQTRTPVFSFFVLLPLAAFLGILLFTNHPLMVSSPFLVPCVIGVLLLPGFLPEKETAQTVPEAGTKVSAREKFYPARPVLTGSLLLVWAAVLLFGRLYLVRTTGGVHYTLFDEISLIPQGPGAGLLTDTETVRRYKDVCSLLDEALPPGAKVFYAGVSSDLYLMKDMEICTPSTISSPTFDEKIGQYFALHPEKNPEYVICDRDLPDLYENGWLTAYLRESCDSVPIAQNDYLTIYKALPGNG